ncbi:MAG: hypothetical protein JSR66_11465 [Proteobacteria bacterium]|nr:hypothetical protein [Pseudomonadota bacterium]
MEYIPDNLLEWFIVPLLLYMFIFWLRDKLNILHMPLADLIALIVIANIAMAIHFEDLRGIFAHIHLAAPESRSDCIRLAVIGVVVIFWLVNCIERRILRVTLHHISVGLVHHPWPHYESAIETFKSPRFRRFTFRWALGFAVTAAVLALHALALSLPPLGFVGKLIQIQAINPQFQAVLLTVGTFIVFVAIAVLLTAARVFRYSETPIEWTFKEDELNGNQEPSHLARLLGCFWNRS